LAAVSEARRAHATQPNAAAALADILAADMQRVEEEIQRRMQSPVGMIPEISDHLVGAGGKRLRPMIAVAAASLCGYRGDGHVKLAAAVEFIHNATLLHDDVVDGSELRRGRQAANLIWGNQATVLVGDFLFARSFNLMVEAGSLAALDVLSRAASVIAEGEVRQLAAMGDVDLTEADYLEIIGAKTAELFAAAAEAPAILADASDEKRRALASYGRSLGLAFQLVDDALDYAGSTAALGKAVGDDFREGKMTMPVAAAVRHADAEERAFWTRVMADKEQREGDLEAALELVRRHGGVEATLVAARAYADSAANVLSVFAPSTLRTTMQDLAGFVVSRVS
jgi:octaprenyl-diphosphate synthase